MDGVTVLAGSAARRVAESVPSQSFLFGPELPTADIATYARVALAERLRRRQAAAALSARARRQAAGPSLAGPQGIVMRIPFLVRHPREYSIEPLAPDSGAALAALHREDFVAPVDRRRVRAADRAGYGVRLCRPRNRQGQGRSGRLRAGPAGRRRGRDPDACRGAQPSPRGAGLAADGRRAARASCAARRKAVPRSRRNQQRRRSRSTAGSAFTRSASARATTSRRKAPGQARLSCGAIFASHIPCRRRGQSARHDRDDPGRLCAVCHSHFGARAGAHPVFRPSGPG